MLKLRLLISTLVSALIGFAIFMGWAIRELAEQFGALTISQICPRKFHKNKAIPSEKKVVAHPSRSYSRVIAMAMIKIILAVQINAEDAKIAAIAAIAVDIIVVLFCFCLFILIELCSF